MYPILLNIKGFALYTQTILLGVACLAGLGLALRYARRLSVPQEVVVDATFWGFLAAILGARLLFVLLNWSYFSLYPTQILTLEGGGLSFQGGLIASGGVVLYIAQRRCLDTWKVGDVLAPGLALALPIMRVGCLMNGCDSGIITTVPWGVMINGAVRHPIQLYEAGLNLFLLPLLSQLANYYRQSLIPSGFLLLIYLFLSSLIRFGVDFYRPLEEKLPIGFTIPQLISLGIMGVSFFYLLSRRSRFQNFRLRIRKNITPKV
jgi:phosphatidylglycerol:prolipoprotein diacylglycerol transferase